MAKHRDEQANMTRRQNAREVRNIQKVSGGTPSKGCAVTALAALGSVVLGIGRGKGWAA